jgi:hypothetical protein
MEMVVNFGNIIVSNDASLGKKNLQSYRPPKLRESQLWEFQDFHLGIPRQNDIWVLVS